MAPESASDFSWASDLRAVIGENDRGDYVPAEGAAALGNRGAGTIGARSLGGPESLMVSTATRIGGDQFSTLLFLSSSIRRIASISKPVVERVVVVRSGSR